MKGSRIISTAIASFVCYLLVKNSVAGVMAITNIKIIHIVSVFILMYLSIAYFGFWVSVFIEALLNVIKNEKPD
jgi:cation transporter-like permease